MEFDPHLFCRIDQRDFIFEHGKGAPCAPNLVDRISLRLVAKFCEAVEGLGNGLALDQAIDVSARACGGIAIELKPKRHALKEEHPHAALPQMAFKPVAFRGLRQGVRAQAESGEANVRTVFFCMPGRSGQGAQQESSAAVTRRPKPNLSPGERGRLRGHFAPKPAAQSIHAPLVNGALAARSPGAGSRCEVAKFSGKLKRCNAQWNRFSHKARKRVLP